MSLPKEIDASRVVKIRLGGKERDLCFPLGAVMHFRDTTGENPAHIAVAKLHRVEFLETAPGRSQPLRFADPKWTIAFLVSGLKTAEPEVTESDVEGWVSDALAESREGATLTSVCNALAGIVMLALHKWHVINVPGLDRRERPPAKENQANPTEAAKPKRQKASTATSANSTPPATAAG